jgi:hypothetical protein
VEAETRRRILRARRFTPRLCTFGDAESRQPLTEPYPPIERLARPRDPSRSRSFRTAAPFMPRRHRRRVEFAAQRRAADARGTTIFGGPIMAKRRKHFCVDRVIPMHDKQRAAAAAVRENDDNRPRMPKRLPGVSAHPAKISIETGKRWKSGRVLGVRFMDGTKFLKDKVKLYAVQWSEQANIRFDFSTGRKAELRVSFEFDPGSSWSAIGTDCLDTQSFPKNEPTINFGWLDEDTEEIEFRRVIVHEFGHAIGAVHEHQVPSGGIQWNKAAVYKAFSGPPNHWSKADIDFNILDKYSVDQLNGTAFDKKSIMLYAFEPALILGPPALKKLGTTENNRLSPKDKSFIRKFYGKPV